MSEELGYEVTPKQSLDGLWRTMHKYIEHHGYSDISLELEGSQYEFRQHLQKYDEYEAKAKAYNLLKSNLEKEVEILIDKVSGFPYVDAPIESTIGHFEYVLEMMKKYESGESQ